MTSDIVHELQRHGIADVDDSSLARALYSTDASLYRVVPKVVVRPRSVEEVLATIGPSLTDVRLFRGPKRRGFGLPDTTDRTFEGVHRSHWWVVAAVK